ncbi:hypothetical protein BDP27DRAFT_1406243 [Rhodocollybia butyracea]|uniref:Uncharacterized protein n=1 Tax=Rhodocollybia butyracea TaxID=206335 RepID=A0A9P5PFK1_9AGAR|nr:hypothetical protein BDP27DRAFT_1406243 [Rhodocollybia butyracea]
MKDGGVPTIDHLPKVADVTTPFNPSKMLYYKLKGGEHCRNTPKDANDKTLIICVGYVISYVVSPPEEKNPQTIIFGGLISKIIGGSTIHHFDVVYQPLPAGLSGEQLTKAKELQDQAYFEFLTSFVWIKQEVMLKYHGELKGDQPPDPVVARAAKALHSQYKKSQKGKEQEQKKRPHLGLETGMERLRLDDKKKKDELTGSILVIRINPSFIAKFGNKKPEFSKRARGRKSIKAPTVKRASEENSSTHWHHLP